MRAKKRCGAKTRAGGECQAWAMPNGRCRIHGGMSLAPGPEHPRWKHGKRSKLAQFAGGPVRREDLHTLLEIAAVDRLIADKITELEDAPTLTWRELAAMAERILSAPQSRLNALVIQLVKRIRQQGSTDASRRELLELLKARAELVRKELAEERKEATVWTAGEIILLIHRIVELLNEHVDSYERRKAIAQPLLALSNRNRPASLEGNQPPQPVRFVLDSTAELT